MCIGTVLVRGRLAMEKRSSLLHNYLNLPERTNDRDFNFAETRVKVAKSLFLPQAGKFLAFPIRFLS